MGIFLALGKVTPHKVPVRLSFAGKKGNLAIQRLFAEERTSSAGQEYVFFSSHSPKPERRKVGCFLSSDEGTGEARRFRKRFTRTFSTSRRTQVRENAITRDRKLTCGFSEGFAIGAAFLTGKRLCTRKAAPPQQVV
jgi:hypothetical protein